MTHEPLLWFCVDEVKLPRRRLGTPGSLLGQLDVAAQRVCELQAAGGVLHSDLV